MGRDEDWIRLAKADPGLSGLEEAGARRRLANGLSGPGGGLSRRAKVVFVSWGLERGSAAFGSRGQA